MSKLSIRSTSSGKHVSHIRPPKNGLVRDPYGRSFISIHDKLIPHIRNASVREKLKYQKIGHSKNDPTLGVIPGQADPYPSLVYIHRVSENPLPCELSPQHRESTPLDSHYLACMPPQSKIIPHSSLPLSSNDFHTTSSFPLLGNAKDAPHGYYPVQFLYPLNTWSNPHSSSYSTISPDQGRCGKHNSPPSEDIPSSFPQNKTSFLNAYSAHYSLFPNYRSLYSC